MQNIFGFSVLLLAAAFPGLVLSRRFIKGAFYAGEHLLFGLSLGLVLFTVFTFLGSYFFQFQPIVPLIVLVLMLLATALMRKNWLATFQKNKTILKSNALGKTDRYGLIIFSVSLLIFTLLMNRLIIWRDGALLTGYIDAWGDLPFHLSLITSFLGSHELELRSTILAGEPLTYPFMTDFFSAILMHLGFTLENAVEWPAIFLNSVTLTLLYYLSYRLVKNHTAALLAPVLFLLGGGLGFLWFLQDVYLASNPIWEVLQHLPQRYTNLPEVNIHWVNPTLAHLIPQRSFLFGFPIGLSIIIIFLRDFNKRKLQNALSTGVLLGLLPLFHTHTFLTLLIVAACLMLYSMRRRNARLAQFRQWLLFGSAALLFAAPQLLYLLSSKVSLEGIRYHLGWMADSENIIWFWLKNLGLVFPLLLVSVVFRKQLNITKPAVHFYLIFALLFIIGNLFLFAPFAYDNNKILIFWYLVSLPFIARLLVYWHSCKSWWIHAAVFRIALVALIFSGCLNLIHELQGGGWEELSAEETALAREVAVKTEFENVFLTAPIHNNLLTMAGRAVVMGYTGHIYSHGLDSTPIEKSINIIYQGEKEADDLLQKLKVDYVVVGPHERNRFGQQVDWFKTEYPVFLLSENYFIYRVEEGKLPAERNRSQDEK